MSKNRKNILKTAALAMLGAAVIGGGIATADFGIDYISSRAKNTMEEADRIERFHKEAETTENAQNEAVNVSADIQITQSELLVKMIDVSDVVENAVKSVVAVNCIEYVTNNGYFGYYFGQSGKKTSESCGTGIIISRQENRLLVLTNNHVVEDADILSVVFVDGKEVQAEVLGTAPDSDVALVAVPLENIEEDTLQAISIAAMGDSDTVKVGNAAIAIGNALGYGQSVTTGVISALNREVEMVDMTLELIQTDAAINAGNSGGPLLNTSGEVIGINSVKYSSTGVEGMCYAIPINTAKPIIEDILNNPKGSEEDEEKPYLGIYGFDITFQYQFMYGMPAGIYISSVEKNSPAEAAGLERGDIITSFNGTAVASMEELSALITECNPYDTVELGVKVLKRNTYHSTVITVTLGNSKDYNQDNQN